MRFFPKHLVAAAALLLIVPLLAGCESMSGFGSNSDKIKVVNADDNTPMDIAPSRLDAAPGVQPVPNFPVPQDRDLKVMTSKLSGGSVEIYNLDDPAPMNGAGVAPVQAEYAGMPMATNPSVTVYPLDGAGGSYPGQLPPPSGIPVPSVQQWPNSILPVGRVSASSGMETSIAGSTGMMPPPGNWKDGARMKIVGGKLAPSVGNDVSRVYFPYGSAGIGSPERSALKNVAETAKFAPVDRVTVEGHASPPTQTSDPIKAKILNLKESMNRAQAVSQNLIEQGVPAEKIKAVGWGDTKPAGGDEAAQRRVDIVTGLGGGQ